MHVEVARVPARLAPDRARVVARRLVGLVGERRVVGELDLHAPAHLAVGVALGLRDDRGDAQLGRPAAGADRPRQEGAGRLAGRLDARLGDVVGLAREPLGRERHVGVARPAPAAELARPPDAVAPFERLVEAEVERVAAAAGLGPVPAVLHADRRGAAGHVEGHHHVALAQVGAELARDHLVRGDRAAAAGGRERRRLRRRGKGEQSERDQCGAEHGPILLRGARAMRQKRELPAQRQLGRVHRAVIPARHPAG